MSSRYLWSDVAAAAHRVLTPRQIDVFRLWCAGAGTARIGLMLDMSESTARTHLRRARQKVKLELERKVAA